MTLKDKTHSIARAAKILGVGRRTCRGMVDKGQLDTVQINDRERITDSSLKSLLEAAGASSTENASAV